MFLLVGVLFILVLIPSTYKKRLINYHDCHQTIVSNPVDNNYCVFELDKKTISEIVGTRPKIAKPSKKYVWRNYRQIISF